MNKVILSITAVASLRQINRTNVRQLEVAWTCDTGEMGGMQTQPVKEKKR